VVVAETFVNHIREPLAHVTRAAEG
jgi:hypothetical protein